MKLKRLEKSKHKKIIIGTLIVISIIVSYLLGKTFAMYQVNKGFEFVNGKVNYYGHSDVYFAYYNGNTWLEDIPKEGNAENLTFEKAVCDNEAEVEWDYREWAPKVKNLTKAKTRCSLYFTKVDTKICNETGSASAACKIATLAKSDTTNLAYDHTYDNNIRYIGASPSNYVTFNNESWRIIGVMNNIKTSLDGKGESRLKIIRNDSIGSIQWSSRNENNWFTSDINNTLQARSEASSNLIDTVIWNISNMISANKTPIEIYNIERFKNISVNIPPPLFWQGKVGLMYMSDYGYAVGESVRTTCLNTKMDNYNTNNCVSNDWLNISAGYEWTIDIAGNVYIFNIAPEGMTGTAFANQTGYTRPVVYLKSSVKITGGNGSSGSPYTLSL